MNESYESFIFPSSVVTKADILHLVNELERVDNEQTAADIREKVGVTEQSELRISRPLLDFLEQNKLTITSGKERGRLIKQLRTLKESAPVIHLTFAVEADRESMQKLAQWLRTSLHPQAVIEIGLQPALIAGVSIRTPNHIHDFSMREMLKKNHGILVKELGALRGNS